MRFPFLMEGFSRVYDFTCCDAEPAIIGTLLTLGLSNV